MTGAGMDGNGMGYQPQSGYTIDEFIDIINQELTVGCALPKQLSAAEIRRIIETRAMPYFYRKYQFAVQKIYYLIAYEAFCTQEFTQYRSVELPCEIQSVSYLYPVRRASLYQLGINTPNLSINLGVTNQPFLSSYVTTIGELGVYKTILDQMSDMMDQLNKYTLKYHFNQLQHRLHILTKVESDVIVEAYANIKPEFLFQDDLFVKYVAGLAKIQLGNLNGRYNLTLPGGVTVNSQDLVSQGKDDVREVDEEIKSQTTSSWFFMVKK